MPGVNIVPDYDARIAVMREESLVTRDVFLQKVFFPVLKLLNEGIDAADTVQLAAVRKDALAAVDELKTKGSDSRRNLDFWGQVGVGAVALGCVSAAALGQVAVGIPCVIGGSASQGLLSFWEKQQ